MMPTTPDDGYSDALTALLASSSTSLIPDFLFRWHGSEERPGELLALLRLMAPDDGALFWQMVAEHWCSFDLIPHRAYAAVFRRHRAAWSPDAMQGDDRAAFDALPAVVTAFRGQDADAPLGLSWTLRRDVAEGFAMGHRGRRPTTPTVFKASIKKSAVALACEERQEAEIVLFAPPPRRAVTVA